VTDVSSFGLVDIDATLRSSTIRAYQATAAVHSATDLRREPPDNGQY
jgi:hypothetical protein